MIVEKSLNLLCMQKFCNYSDGYYEECNFFGLIVVIQWGWNIEYLGGEQW